ncbi:hypothetical protein FRC02_002358 [Tulasnella sp. 418]|nr:hypothetical protein FRC02_002358 [Tulasnella sp. 418]
MPKASKVSKVSSQTELRASARVSKETAKVVMNRESEAELAKQDRRAGIKKVKKTGKKVASQPVQIITPPAKAKQAAPSLVKRASAEDEFNFPTPAQRPHLIPIDDDEDDDVYSDDYSTSPEDNEKTRKQRFSQVNDATCHEPVTCYMQSYGKSRHTSTLGAQEKLQRR